MTLARNRTAKSQREIDRWQKELEAGRHKQRMRQARAGVRVAKDGWAEKLKQIRGACDARRRAITERAKAERARLAKLVAAERAETAGGCDVARISGAAAKKQAILDAQAMVAQEIAEWQQGRRQDRTTAQRDRATRRKSATIAERMAERDQAVERDLAPEQVPYWRKLKRQIYARQKELAAQGRYATPAELFSEHWEAEQKSIEADLEKLHAERSDAENEALRAQYEREEAARHAAFHRNEDAEDEADAPFRTDEPEPWDVPAPTPAPAKAPRKPRAPAKPRARKKPAKAAPAPKPFEPQPGHPQHKRGQYSKLDLERARSRFRQLSRAVQELDGPGRRTGPGKRETPDEYAERVRVLTAQLAEATTRLAEVERGYRGAAA